MSAGIFVVDDDRSVRYVLSEALREAGFTVQAFDSADAALAALAAGTQVELVFTDVRMPGTGGLDFLEALRRHDAQLPVVVMSAYTDVATTAGAFRGGARDYLAKPFDLDAPVRLARELLKAGGAGASSRHKARAGSSANGPAKLEEVAPLLGHSAPMRELFRAIGRYAQLPLAVLVTGETGTGKELVARALHAESPRATRPFVALNTAAIPSELLESELFGHEAGAFTGANRRQVGRFEQADGGTLFLDEIGDMPAGLQTRLLRVLAEGEFFRVGGRELIRVDVRVIAATHQDLAARVREGRFREDLLHRFDVLRISLPPLRERREDIPLLAERFIDEAAQAMGLDPRRLDAAAVERLQRHPFPGNVRELRNLCFRLVALAAGERIPVTAVDAALREAGAARPALSVGVGDDPRDTAWRLGLEAAVQARLAAGEQGFAESLREAFDASVLATALAHHHGHRQRAAAQLGIGRNTVARKLGPGRRGRKPADGV
ncbi:nitrogen regulation protein NR(I) [Silanimonas sp.]|uniref:nitrogen regulation protein NR(I) n=1 Tax=Silanimonas sp. TaxID=1929290 RepID=UPI001BC7C5B0|nr:nitrogen regulation protein NR(I) [Silanimonas sp.]MBS3896970.1 nitrogen regulation protein NR(I) [Silanimonas sp.]MBS3924031.1 nitrogen regulation protein NR(I) [Xanthomonadaceae bacterium]